MAESKKDEKAEPEAEEPQGFPSVPSATKPIIAPDGHVNLSQEEIDARDK